MRSIIILFGLLCSVLAGDQRMKCYYCSGPMDGSCAKATESDMVEVLCGRRNVDDVNGVNSPLRGNNDLYFNCVKFVRPLPGNVKAFVRGCSVSPTPGDPCSYLRKKIHALDCNSCNTTLCNNDTVNEPAVFVADYIYSP